MKTTRNIMTSSDEVSKLIKIVIAITIIFAIFYVITIFLVMDEEETVKEEDVAEIQYDYILTGNMFNRNNDEYYVLVTNSNEYVEGIYLSYFEKYNESDEPIRIYYSQLNNPFNEKYLASESNLVSNDDIRFKTDTLLKIKNGKITESYEGKDLIIEHLKEITKEVEE